MLKLVRQAAVVLLAAGFLAASLAATGSPARALASARPSGTSPASTSPAGAVAGLSVADQLVASASGPTRIKAWGAELLNASTGKRLWSRNRNRPRPMGSITKVMTALVVIRAGRLSRHIKITRAVRRYIRRHPDASSAGLRVGDVLTARRLGMLHTHFSNFDGLPLPTEHSTYSTPGDLVILGQAAMDRTVFRRIVHRRSHGIAPTSAHHGYRWKTTNLLL